MAELLSLVCCIFVTIHTTNSIHSPIHLQSQWLDMFSQPCLNDIASVLVSVKEHLELNDQRTVLVNRHQDRYLLLHLQHCGLLTSQPTFELFEELRVSKKVLEAIDAKLDNDFGRIRLCVSKLFRDYPQELTPARLELHLTDSNAPLHILAYSRNTSQLSPHLQLRPFPSIQTATFEISYTFTSDLPYYISQLNEAVSGVPETKSTEYTTFAEFKKNSVEWKKNLENLEHVGEIIIVKGDENGMYSSAQYKDAMKQFDHNVEVEWVAPSDSVEIPSESSQ